MKLALMLKEQNSLEIHLEGKGGKAGAESLTISQEFDKLLISSIDKIWIRNTMDRLSLKALKIEGKINKKAVFGIILGAVNAGLEA